jgi:hypothetical protein
MIEILDRGYLRDLTQVGIEQPLTHIATGTVIWTSRTERYKRQDQSKRWTSTWPSGGSVLVPIWLTCNVGGARRVAR